MGNSNLNFEILSEQKEFTLTNLPKYSLSLSPQDPPFRISIDSLKNYLQNCFTDKSLSKPASARFRGRPNLLRR